MVLKEYMECEGISAPKLAQILGISVTQLNQYVYGKTIPRKGMMMKICIATKGMVDANAFYGTTKFAVEKKLLEIAKLSRLSKVE